MLWNSQTVVFTTIQLLSTWTSHYSQHGQCNISVGKQRKVICNIVLKQISGDRWEVRKKTWMTFYIEERRAVFYNKHMLSMVLINSPMFSMHLPLHTSQTLLRDLRSKLVLFIFIGSVGISRERLLAFREELLSTALGFQTMHSIILTSWVLHHGQGAYQCAFWKQERRFAHTSRQFCKAPPSVRNPLETHFNIHIENGKALLRQNLWVHSNHLRAC